MAYFDMQQLDDAVGGVTQPMLPRSLAKRSPGGVLTTAVQPGSALPMTAARYREMALKYAQEAADAETAEPDLSSAQEYLRKRSGEGDAAMLNALAAQFAGEQFQPVQAQFLKRAAAAQEPLKIGTGFMTPDGQYVRDTVADAQRKATAKARQAQVYDQMATGLETAEQRRQDALDKRSSDERYRQDMLDLRWHVANNKPVDNTKAYRTADNLRNEYTKRADKVREGTGHAQNVLTLLADPTIARDPTKQVSLVFSFGKMLDPESVVRESEYSLIANARGLYDSLQQLIPQLQTGAKLTPQQLKSMQAIAQSLMSGSSGRLDDLSNYYRDLALRRNVDPQDVLPSYATRPQAAPGAGAPNDLAAAARAELERRKAQK